VIVANRIGRRVKPCTQYWQSQGRFRHLSASFRCDSLSRAIWREDRWRRDDEGQDTLEIDRAEFVTDGRLIIVMTSVEYAGPAVAPAALEGHLANWQAAVSALYARRDCAGCSLLHYAA
jgi:hypothetical protein